MASVSSVASAFLQQDRRRPAASSGGCSNSNSLKEIEEEITEGSDRVYVAVAKDFRAWKANLIWVLKNIPRTKKIVIMHVHVPSPVIPIMGAWFPADQLKPEEVKAFRLVEQATMENAVNEYLDGCLSVKEVKADKLVIEADDIGQGILQLISKHRIANLVMGAAADKYYTKKLKEPKSRKALMLQQDTDSSCKIWFVCKGNLICTREVGPYGSETAKAPKDNSPSQSEKNLKSSPQMRGQNSNFQSDASEESFKHSTLSPTSDSHEEATVSGSVQENYACISSSEIKEGTVIDVWEGISRSGRISGRSMKSLNDDVLSNTSSTRIPKDGDMEEGSFILPSEDAGLDDELYKDLKHIVSEAKNLTREAYEESLRRQKAERDLHEVVQKAKTTEDLYTIELKQRKQIEKRLSQEKNEQEEIRRQRDEMFEELQKAHEQRVALEIQLADSKCTAMDLEKKLQDAHFLLVSLQDKHVEMRKERDNAVKEAEKLRQKMEEMASKPNKAEHFSEFSYSELEQATNKFDDSLKIGEGGYGIVYKGLLHQKTVAIKMLNSQGLQGQKEFHKEVNILSRLRHPNLVHLIGVCSEAWALVYDFLPNGSLEDRLICKDNTPPLSWPVRLGIAIEICAALHFLHSNKSFTVVHGDLKPANILLDADFSSKLGDFGISGLVHASNNSTALYRCTHAMGTFVYMDPEFLASGDLTPRSDVYSFGIIVLRLLTGRSAFGINRAVQEVVEKGCLGEILDAAAGEWPCAVAEQLAHLGLRCCEITRRNRPDAKEALRVLETLPKSDPGELPPLPPK